MNEKNLSGNRDKKTPVPSGNSLLKGWYFDGERNDA